ncbi:MAG TPA: polysaccharide biosynthesis/export family protein [Terriglobales bacterium]|nr:polysaccharide biosynthesis/export family protein [Terriglobales bacterium]
MSRRVLLIFTALLLALACHAQSEAGQASTPPASGLDTKPAATGPQSQQQRYRVVQGDVLNLQFPFASEYDATVTIQPDGFISPRGIKSLHVEGMTTPEIRDALVKAYSPLLHEPTISVNLQSFVQPYFIAYGEVTKPGKYTLYGNVTVSQALGVAGGYRSSAKHSEVYLFRRISPDWVSSQKLDLKRMLGSGDLADDPQVQPGDMIWVPKSGMAKFLSVQAIMPWKRFTANFGPSF